MLKYKNKTYNFKKTTIYYENKQFMKINCCTIENYKICNIKTLEYKIGNQLYNYKNRFNRIYNSKIRSKPVIKFINDLSLKINNEIYFNYNLTPNKTIVISELLKTINIKLIKNNSYDIIPILHKTDTYFYILYDVVKYMIEQTHNVSLIECHNNLTSCDSDDSSVDIDDSDDSDDLEELDELNPKFNEMKINPKFNETKSNLQHKIINEHIRSQFECNNIILECDDIDEELIITEINNNNNLLTQYVNIIVFNSFGEKMIKNDIVYQMSYNTNILTEYNNNQKINTQLLISTIEKNNSLLSNLLN
jgi:hypothetical protein